MISGFMIVKNVLKTGYPFVEAIASALPVCDEFLISEGYSDDGTCEVIERMAKLNPKIKVFRYQWPAARRFSVLGEVTNTVRAKCSGDYIFSIQANEIVHEDSQEYIRAMPEMCPTAHTFSLPFLHLMGNYKFSEEYRLRFAKNMIGIIAIGDAYALGPSKAFVRSEALRSLKSPRKLVRYIGKGIQWTYANGCTNALSRAMYLPKPIYRYWAMFPQNYLEKWAKHKEMFNVQGDAGDINTLKAHVDNPPVFWKLTAEAARKHLLGFNYPERLGSINVEDHPRIMQGIVSDLQAKSYYVRDEVLDSIKNL
jgi:glycosyltransferase involved in cell wall biosynthesis